MNGTEFIATFSNIVIACAAAFASYVGWKGLNAWKSQQRWQDDAELARKILILLFKHRDAIASVRNPGMLASEMRSAAQDLKLSENQQKKVAGDRTGIVYERRWEIVYSIRSELYPLLLEAHALWGKKSITLFDPIFKLESELASFFPSHFRMIFPSEEEIRNSRSKNLNERRDIMYDFMEETAEEDAFKKDYQKALELIEEFMRTKLGRLR